MREKTYDDCVSATDAVVVRTHLRIIPCMSFLKVFVFRFSGCSFAPWSAAVSSARTSVIDKITRVNCALVLHSFSPGSNLCQPEERTVASKWMAVFVSLLRVRCRQERAVVPLSAVLAAQRFFHPVRGPVV